LNTRSRLNSKTSEILLNKDESNLNRQTKLIDIYEFWLVGEPIIQRTANGELAEYVHDFPKNKSINKYGAGPFCKFGLPGAPNAQGVYVIFVDSVLVYIGRCENLSERFSSRGYGSISPRNIHSDGQSTNCKLNSRILNTAKNNSEINIWFYHTKNFIEIEAQLISSLRPAWNAIVSKTIQHDSGITTIFHQKIEKKRKQEDDVASKQLLNFDLELDRLFQDAIVHGQKFLDVNAGELHRLVGGYPGINHRMPTCCSRMRKRMDIKDSVLQTPLKGNGASLTIRYYFPKLNR
jgi:hypothetical protein